MTRCTTLLLAAVLTMAAGCSKTPPPPSARARHFVLVTIDTLRADRVGAYGYASARTPHIDGIAKRGLRFDRAFATAPITLPSHASIMSGLYPPGHGSRHNGLPVDPKVPTIATTLASAGFSTGAFVGAFPLDRRFGLHQGFAAYDDAMPRNEQGRLQNERTGKAVTDAAISWFNANRSGRVFLWVHLFEPHAPYGNPESGVSTAQRYDEDIAEADAQVGRLLDALGPLASDTLVAIAADHGEAFGEHDEISHSVFVYDTTLRVPFLLAGPGVPVGTIEQPVSMTDIAPTVLPLLGVKAFDADGINLASVFTGATLPARELYAESYAPMLDFGWSPLRSVRAGRLKYIAAPREELYDLSKDPGETTDISATDPRSLAELKSHVGRYGADAIAQHGIDTDARARLNALGYVGGTASANDPSRADPKDRRALLAALARVMSGELRGADLERALEAILREDPGNAQAHARLGNLLVESNRCGKAVAHLNAAITAELPGVDAYLDLALCQLKAGQTLAAATTLREASRLDPGNPVVLANLGMLESDAGRHNEGVPLLRRAVEIDPDFHEARFNLARVLGRSGRRAEARAEVEALLARLPEKAPQRPEVLRLLQALK